MLLQEDDPYGAPDGAPSSLVRVASRHISPVEEQANRLTEILAPEGKCVVSVWQLRSHFELHQQMHTAVDCASLLLADREEASKSPRWMSTLEWFERCGLASHECQSYVHSMEVSSRCCLAIYDLT